MPIDVRTQDSPGWWLQLLSDKLRRRQSRLARLHAYYEGNPPLPEGAQNARKAYKEFQKKARTNFAELCVEATLERMRPKGFRTAASGDENGDEAAKRIWKGNDLDVEMPEVFRSMLAMGDGYAIVGQDETGQPVITAEDPRQVVTVHDPVRQRVCRAGLKLFHDPIEGLDLAYLYLPGVRFVAQRPASRSRRTMRYGTATWEWDNDRGGVEGEAFDSEFDDVVPVVRFRNKRGIGEFEPHTDVLDRINHMLLQRMVIATMQAFRQRALKGDLPDVYPADHPQAGQKIDYDGIFEAEPGALWEIPEGVDLWESEVTDFSPVLKSVSDDVQHFAAVTRTPLYYMNPDAVNQSAEGASLAREGLVFKAEDRMARAESGLIDVMSLAFRFAGDPERADRDKLEVLWAPAERRSLAERADASVKAGSDLPWQAKAELIWQLDPATIKRYADLRQQEQDADPALRAARALTGDDDAA